MKTHICGGWSFRLATIGVLGVFFVEAAIACEPSKQQGPGMTQGVKAPVVRCAPEEPPRVVDEQSRKAAAAKSDEFAATKEAKDAWFKARQAEAKGDYKDAVRIFRTLARKGHGPAAKRLGDMYATGVATVSKDLVESRQWYAVARENGEKIAEQR